MELPDAIAKQMHLDGPQSHRRALESLALESYRSGELSAGQVGEILGLNFHETERFLKEHQAYIDLTLEEFDKSSAALEKLLTGK